jgi:hypothetical protein
VERSRDSRFEALGFFIVSVVGSFAPMFDVLGAPEQEQSGAESRIDVSIGESVDSVPERKVRKREVCQKTSVSVFLTEALDSF